MTSLVLPCFTNDCVSFLDGPRDDDRDDLGWSDLRERAETAGWITIAVYIPDGFDMKVIGEAMLCPDCKHLARPPLGE